MYHTLPLFFIIFINNRTYALASFIPLLMQEGLGVVFPLLTHTSLPASPYARGGVKRVSPKQK